GGAGEYDDAGYTLHVEPILPQPLNFDGGTAIGSSEDALRGAYYYVDVPSDSLGWDVRLSEVTAGIPGIAIAKDFLPISLTTTLGYFPNTATNWPSGVRWGASRDWTERSQNADGIGEDGRILAMGKGRPLEPGRYYISVLGRITAEPLSYTLPSRVIGDGYTIPVNPLADSGGTVSVTNLAPREAAYFSVTVPPNSRTLKVRVNATAGEVMLAAAKDTLPNVLVAPTATLTNSAGRKMQKTGDEYFLELPPAGNSNVLASTFYHAVIGEGNSPQPGHTGLGTSDFTITSIGAAPVRNVGQLGFTDLLETNSL